MTLRGEIGRKKPEQGSSELLPEQSRGALSSRAAAAHQLRASRPGDLPGGAAGAGRSGRALALLSVQNEPPAPGGSPRLPGSGSPGSPGSAPAWLGGAASEAVCFFTQAIMCCAAAGDRK